MASPQLHHPPFARRAWFQALAGDASVRADLIATLRAAPFEAAFWETPPMSPATFDLPAAYVLVDSPALAAVAADPKPFERPLARAPGDIAAFPNLSGDARLVVPREGAAHLLAFVRTVPDAVAHAFWARVGEEVEKRCARGGLPFWVSTSGLGVYWLHVRLDIFPKYYSYREWRAEGA